MLRIAAGAICGIAAGAITGIAARVAMRMVADGVPDSIRSLPMFTAEGTATIVGLGALAGAPFGALFALAYDALAGPHRARGILFGVAAGLLFEPSLRIARRVPAAVHAVLALIALGGGVLVASGISGFAVQAVQTHGALAAAYAVPWLVVGVLVGWTLRSRERPLARA